MCNNWSVFKGGGPWNNVHIHWMFNIYSWIILKYTCFKTLKVTIILWYLSWNVKWDPRFIAPCFLVECQLCTPPPCPSHKQCPSWVHLKCKNIDITPFGYNMKTCTYVHKSVKSLEYSWVYKLHLQDTLFIELV